MSPTKIEWATEVWNPVSGCTKVSEGCRNCYAERIVQRFGDRVHGNTSGPDPDSAPFSQVICHLDRLEKPLHWRKPRRVFVCSMGDLFHDDVPDLFIAKVLDIVQACPQHTFIVLTKRPERMSRWPVEGENGIIPNLWLGVSVEDQKTADERIPLLLQTPAAVRFVSCEPMLGPVDLFDGFGGFDQGLHLSASIDWVICGGESGPGARPMHPDWALSLRDQCSSAGMPFFFKQWGEWMPDGETHVGSGFKTAWVHRRRGEIPFDDVTDDDIDNFVTTVMARAGKKYSGNRLLVDKWEQYPNPRAVVE